MTAIPDPKWETAKTTTGRKVVVCYCGGGDKHEWKPQGSGASTRIFQCPDCAPVQKA